MQAYAYRGTGHTVHPHNKCDTCSGQPRSKKTTRQRAKKEIDMGRNANRIKERAAEFEDQYNDKMIEDLNEQLADYIEGEDVLDIDPEEIMELVTAWKDKLPEIGDWCFDQVNN